jgi:hypothetical protein
MFKDRLRLYERLEADRGSNVIVYITGDRRGLETKISAEVVDLFIHHLDYIGVVDKLTSTSIREEVTPSLPGA